MKRLILMMALVMAVSCGKSEDNTLEKITDTIIGRYMCRSITIQGYELDLNDDGVVGNDMLAEFESFEFISTRLKSETIRIHPVKNYGEVEMFYIDIPKQKVYYDKRSGEYFIKDMYGGDSMSIGFQYSVEESGKIVAMPYNEGNSDLSKEDYDTISLIDYMGNSAKEISFDQNGHIEALVECTCYDFATESLVTVPAIYVYERVSYQLY